MKRPLIRCWHAFVMLTYGLSLTVNGQENFHRVSRKAPQDLHPGRAVEHARLGHDRPADHAGALEHTVANDPDNAYRSLVDGDGKWIVRRDVRIRDHGAKHGGLTVGYGARPEHIGPELGFGHYVGDRLENPVLIIKAAWGGKSLGGDFRPPRSGGKTGHYYKEILRLVREATTDLGAYVPDYRGQGFEIAGFACGMTGSTRNSRPIP